MSIGIKIECPKCHADRTMMETTFGLPACVHPNHRKKGDPSINDHCAVPVRLVMCPRCHYLELYHDVGLGQLT